MECSKNKISRNITQSVQEERSFCSPYSRIMDHKVESENISEGRDPSVSITISPLSPLPTEIVCPRSSNAAIHSEVREQVNEKKLPWFIHYISLLVHLAVFGILGVLTRYILQKLFGPGGVGFTSDQNILYLDLPSNMVGSFLMGWWGVVFKKDISKVSDFLVIGLTTGYLGSLTTFSGWNQKMLDLSIKGHWVLVVLGFLIGLFTCVCSITFGVQTAEGFKKRLLKRLMTGSNRGTRRSKSNWKYHIAVMVVMILMLGLLWGVNGALEEIDINGGGDRAQLWLACIVAPLGVWIRWLLARLNGRGLGRAHLLKWVPFGTLIANVSACCVMAALATLKKAVKTKMCDTIATGVQIGLLGCLSTVSTFITEFRTMTANKQPWRANAYAMITIVTSFSLGTLIFSVPVWTKGYD